ncbi:hypothetical protein GCM10007989_19680 [Devosia pacifica]|uniref:Invasion associated locus B (IalB) protein n=1 Tax=Devosia pacifica TaxID=1335967 RepID=A0A918S4G1_9HYPH|nr:invasion associated locus B family protein [Devosia pacifica]GHA24095.1 hypothetical protein GCM10007989_19680 [Devosia pacifica]
MRYSTRGMITGLMTCALMSLSSLPAMAQAQSLGTFGQWTAWKGTDDSGEICYISSQPGSSEPSNVNRGPIHFLIIHRKGMGVPNEVQTLVGYPLNTTDANASAAVDGTAYPMVIEGEAAWLASTADEAPFVRAFRAGSRLVVRARSERGTDTTDTYSLSGSADAMDAIDEACGMGVTAN